MLYFILSYFVRVIASATIIVTVTVTVTVNITMTVESCY